MLAAPPDSHALPPGPETAGARPHLPDLGAGPGAAAREHRVCGPQLRGAGFVCRAGGLGVRVTELTRELAAHGFPTHLYFVGDPAAARRSRFTDGRLFYHRWCQWISRYHPQRRL